MSKALIGKGHLISYQVEHNPFNLGSDIEMTLLLRDINYDYFKDHSVNFKYKEIYLTSVQPHLLYLEKLDEMCSKGKKGLMKYLLNGTEEEREMALILTKLYKKVDNG